MSDRAARELHAETTIAGPPEHVWEALTDLRAMAERSPELVRMVPLKPGGLKVGQQYLGLNRRRAIVWPTRSVVAAVEPGRSLAWDTRSSGARWIYELEPAAEGTRVVHRRPVPRKLTLVSRLFAALFLGGTDEHSDELEQGMHRTLERLKTAVER